jgi:type II secretory pathway predicted ATPase ExeA
VSDPPSKSWPEDDPSFLASLDDLDRGLNESRPAVADAPASLKDPLVPAAAPVVVPIAPRKASGSPTTPRPASSNAPAPLVPPGTFGDPDDTPPPLTFRRPEPGDPRAHRPLLDLFPVTPLERGVGPMPGRGTAVGPQLPPRPRSRPNAESAGRSRDGLTFEAFYGLRERPFSLSTDPKFHYQSAAHGRASRELLAAIGNRRGPAVLTGALGLGKTTLCRALVQEIDRRTVTSLVLEPLQSLDDLLKTMLVDFGVVARQGLAGADPTRELLASTLKAFLESLVPLQGSAVVFIDEAQNVPAPVLGELDALCPGSPDTRVLQLVLVGQPDLLSLLDKPELRTLKASIARRSELGPLAADEIAPYVAHRLSIAGAHTRVEFEEAAIARLFELSGGSPRTVSLLCDRAMTRGHTSSADVIATELIQAAAVDLDLEAPPADRPGVLRTALLAAVFVLLMLAGAAGALWIFRDAVNRVILQWEQVPLPPGAPARSLPVPMAPIPPPSDTPEDAKPSSGAPR